MGGAVVLFQTNDPRAPVLLFKVQNVLDGCAPEAVNALVVVAHHADVLMTACKQGRQEVLHMVGVLILVHQHVPEFALIILQNILVLLQKLNGDVDDVVKIQGVVVLQAGLVFAVGTGDVLRPDVAGALRPVQHLPGRHHFVLLPADGAKDIFRRKRLIVQLHVLDDLFHDALGVRGIVNGKAPGKAHPLDVPPQDAAAGGMKRHRPDILRLRAEKIGKPLLHFICGLVGKGDGDDAPGCGGFYSA